MLIISQFLRADGCVLPRRVTGLCYKAQKRLQRLAHQAQRAGYLIHITCGFYSLNISSHEDWVVNCISMEKGQWGKGWQPPSLWCKIEGSKTLMLWRDLSPWSMPLPLVINICLTAHGWDISISLGYDRIIGIISVLKSF